MRILLSLILSIQKWKMQVCLALLCIILYNIASAQVFRQKMSAVNMTSPYFGNYEVTSMLMDADGHVWTGTLNGLYVSRGMDVSLFPLAKTNDKVISSLYIYNRMLYVGTNEGITSIDLDKLDKKVVDLKDENGNSIHNYCMVVRVDNNGKLLYYTGYNTGAYYELDLHTGKSDFLFNHSDGYREIRLDARGRVQALWAIETSGLLEHDMQDRPVSRKNYFDGNNGQPLLSIHNAKFDGNDTLWCATNKGLIGMDVNTHSYKQVTFSQHNVYEVEDLVLDGSDVICATKNAGLIIWNRATNQIRQAIHQPDDRFSLLSDKVVKLYMAPGRLLIAATDKGISAIALDAALQYVYRPQEGSVVHAVVKGRYDWFTSIDNKLISFNGPGFSLLRQAQLDLDEYAVTATQLVNKSWLVLTNKQILVWGEGKLISLTSPQREHAVAGRIVPVNDSLYYLCGQTGIYSWRLGNNYTTWLAQTDREPYQWYNTVVPVNDSVILSNAYLSFIKVLKHRKDDSLHPLTLFKTFANINDWTNTKQHKLLLAGSTGLHYYNYTANKLEKASTDFDNEIYRIVVRGIDTLLIGEKELYRFRKGGVSIYPSPFTGLLNVNGVERLAAYGANIWFAHGGELFRMPYAASFDSGAYFFTDVRYKGKTCDEEINLFSNNNLLLNVYNISYLPYTQLFVQYKLSGVDTAWNKLDGSQIKYTQLQPGDYNLTIQVRAGRQSFFYRQYAIVVHPAWYQTVWAIFGAVLLLLSGVIFFFVLRIKSIRAKSRRDLALQRQFNELENKALRAQMNPHFLFNTLNSINHYILNSETKEASHYLTRFSKLVRLVLENSRKEFVSLDRELEALNLYMELEMMRRNNEFDYSISVNKQVASSSFLVPPMILQPFVENAIWHGLSTITSGGFIEITIVAEGEDGVCIVIEDNGVGYDPAKTPKQAEGHNSFGMSGTQDRLRLMHADNKCVIEPLYDEGKPNGTKVKVYIYND